MSQSTSFLRGQQATSDALNAAIAAATEPGLKKKVTFEVTQKTVRVSAHIGVYGCGVSTIESSALELDTTPFFSVGAGAFAGTLCYRLDASLYKRPVLLIERGVLAVNNDPLLLIIGWVRYPGSNIALSSKHFESAPVSSLAFNLPFGDRDGFLHYDPTEDSYAWMPMPASDDHKVLSDENDKVPGTLSEKVSDTETVTLRVNPVTRMLEANFVGALPAADDRRFLSSGEDTEPGFMNSKIADSDTIELIVNADNKLEANFIGFIPAPDDHLLLGWAGDTEPGTLHDKIKDTPTVKLEIDPADSRLKATALGAPPIGNISGGDLTGPFTSPLVHTITGVGAGLVPVATDFMFPPSVYGAPNGGRGIGAGRSYRSGAQVKAWCALAETGELFWTFNDWKTSVHDNSLTTTSGVRWNCLRFGFLAAHSSYAWVAGDGNHRLFYYALHTPANYNTDGTLKSSAWQSQAYAETLPGNVGDFAMHGNVVCFVGNDSMLGYTNDFTTFSVAINLGFVLGGVDTDRYGTWLAIERDTGRLLRSTTDGTSWSLVTDITVNGSAAASLPVDHGEQWGSIQSAYGLWVAAVWNVGSTRISYAYSGNGVDWMTFTDPTATAFYSAAFDGIRWFAVNPAANSAPAISEMLVSSVPVLRRLACAAGLAVAGGIFAIDIPGADMIRSDENGKFSGASIPAGAVLLGTDANKNLVASTAAIPNVTVSTSDPTGTPADGDMWLKIV